MELRNMSDKELVSNVKNLVGKERELTSEILKYLCEIESRKIYLERGYSSMFAFCTEYLHYDESQAQRRISASRLIREIPELEPKVEAGRLSITNLSMAQSFFNSMSKQDKALAPERKIEVLSRIENKSKRECEKILVNLNPEMKVIKKTIERPVPGDQTEIRVVLSRSAMEKINKLRALYSHQDLDLSDLIEKMADALLLKKNPANKGVRNIPAPESVTRNIPASVKAQVYRRDFDGCQFKDPLTQRKCRSKFQLQIEHKIPYSMGGTHEITNLELLCAGHNRLRAINVFGVSKMNQYSRSVE